MPTAQDTMQQATALLKDGQVQQAHDLLIAKLANPDPPPEPAPAPAEPVVARPVPAWVQDTHLVSGFLGELLPLLEELVLGFGSQPRHVAALHRLHGLQAGLQRAPAAKA